MRSESGAHTDGDSIVFFRGSNVISAGEVFLTTGYPVIDLKRGRSIQGEIQALNHIIALAIPHAMQEAGTMVIPGHGRLCDQADVTVTSSLRPGYLRNNGVPYSANTK